MRTSELIYRGLRPLAKRISPWLSEWEDQHFASYRFPPTDHAPVFIIGAPRTGSTILNQLLTQHFDVAYVSNLADIFYKNLPFGVYLHHRWYGDEVHQTQTSRFGNTRHLSLRAPSEGGDFWYRWLPQDRHFVDAGEVAPHAIAEMQATIFSIINYFNKPLLFKNLNMGQRLRLVHEMSPRAKCIWIRRAPLYTAQSILQARRQLAVPAHRWWSVQPADAAQIATLEEIPMVVRQVYALEQQIATDRTLFPADQFTEVTYHELCDATEQQLERIGHFLGAAVRHNDSPITAPTDQNHQKVSPGDFEAIRTEVQQYNWDTYA